MLPLGLGVTIINAISEEVCWVMEGEVKTELFCYIYVHILVDSSSNDSRDISAIQRKDSCMILQASVSSSFVEIRAQI